jgi:transcriptional regulator with XRE-family HTH domain
MTNKENFKALVSKETTNTVERNRARIKNRTRLRESQQIALKVLNKLDEPGWTQRRLAKEMGVSPQQITKIVKGKENLTLETQIKLQEILDIPILASYYEKAFAKFAEQIIDAFKVKETKSYTAPIEDVFDKKDEKVFLSKTIKMEYDSTSSSYEHYPISA